MAHDVTPRRGAVLDRAAFLHTSSQAGPRLATALPVNRRKLLQVGMAGGVALPSAVLALAGGLRAERTDSGFAVYLGAERLWQADTRWLARPSAVRIEPGAQALRITLDGARYPGTDIDARLEIQMAESAGTVRAHLIHSLAGDVPEVDLRQWAAGQAQALARPRPGLLRFAGLAISAPGTAWLALQPDLGVELRAEAQQALAVEGRMVSGSARSCRIAPADKLALASGGMPPDTRAMRVSLSGPDAALRVTPVPMPGSGALRVQAFRTAALSVELAQEGTLAPRHALLVRDIPQLVLRDAPDASRESALLVAREANWAAASDGGQLLHAGQLLARASDGEAVFHGRTRPGESAVIDASGDSCTVDCALAWQRGAFAHGDGISVTLRPRPGRDGATMRRAIGQVLDNAPWRLNHIPLDDAELEFFRAEDSLWLRFHLRGYELRRALTRMVLRRLKPGPGTARPLMWLVMPPQAVSEQAFFRPPAFKPAPSASGETDCYGIALKSAPNERRKSLGQSSGNGADRVRDGKDTQYEPVPTNRPVQARVAGESQLCFERRAAAPDEFPVQLAALLDGQCWALRVAASAYSSVDSWRRASGLPGFPQDTDAAEMAEATRIEMPWRMTVSPDEQARLAHGPLVLQPGGFHPVFYLSARPGSEAGAPAAPGTPLPLRVIASPDHDPLRPLQLHYGAVAADPARVENRRQSLDEQDRNQLVWLTARWGRDALLGTSQVRPKPAATADCPSRFGTYEPAALQASLWRLTALGGAMRSQGSFDPPYLRGRSQDCTDVGGGLAMSIEEWSHISSQGRSHFDRVVYRGFLMPYGHRAVLIKLTQREIECVDGRGWVAVNTQRYFIRVVEPQLRYPLPGQPLASRNAFCQPETLRVVLSADLQIDDPKTPVSGQLASLGASAFIIHVGGAPHPFELQFGASTLACCHLAFVDNTITHDPELLRKVVADFNARARLPQRTVQVHDGDITFAPPQLPGDTVLPTSALAVCAVIAAELVNSVLLESARRAPFYPAIDRANVMVRSIATQTGSVGGLQPVWVAYDAAYRSSGFDPQGNPAEVYLDLEQEQPLGFRGRAERSGGVSNPDMTARALSRSRGLVAFRGSDVAPLLNLQAPLVSPLALRLAPSATTSKVESSVTFDLSAKVLGAIPLSALLDSLDLGDLPKLIEQTESRLDAAGKNMAAQALPVVQAGARAVHGAAGEWRAMCAGQSNAWCTGKDYTGVQVQLDALASQLDTVAKSLSPGRQPSEEVLRALALASRQAKALADTLRDLTQRPELLLASMVQGQEFKGLFDWFDQMVGMLADGPLGRLEAAAQRAHGIVQGELNRLAQFENQVRQIGQDLENRAYGMVRQVQDQALLLACDLEQQKRAWAGQTLDKAISALLSAAGGMAGRLIEIYDVYLALHDELRVLAAQANAYAAEWQALQAAVKRTHQLLPEAFNRARGTVFDALAQWERMVDARLRDTEVAARQEVARRAEPHLREVRDLCLAIAKYKKDGTAIGGMAVANMAAELLRCIDGVDAVLQKARREADAQLRTWIDERHRELVADATQLTNQLDSQVLAPLDAQLLHPLAQAAAALEARLGPVAAEVPRVLELLRALKATPRELYAQLAVLLEAAALPPCLLDPKPVPAGCLEDWPFYQTLLGNGLDMVNALWSVLQPVAAQIHALVDQQGQIAQGWLRTLASSEVARSVLGQDFVSQLVTLATDMGNLTKIQAPLDLASARKVAILLAQRPGPATKLQELLARLDAAQLVRNIKAEVVRQANAEISKLAARFIPARVSTSYGFSRAITRDYCGIFKSGLEPGTCPKPGTPDTHQPPHTPDKAWITLETHMEADLLEGTSSFRLAGSLEYFRVNILNLIELPVRSVAFHADTKSGFHMDTPQFCEPTFDGSPLKFLKAAMELLGGGGGFFLMPLPSGIRSGFFIRKDLLQAGGMAMQNFSFEAALLLPFDDRSAEVSCAVASRDEPLLISIGPWGGGGFFEMVMAMDRVLSISASFEFGLVGAFNLAVISGRGRVTVGLYYRLGTEGTVLEGFFFAGGDATVLGIVSISANLTVRLRHENGSARGEGRFGVRVGAGPFSWTLHYSVTHSQGNGTRRLAAGPLVQVAGHGDKECTGNGSADNASELGLPVDESLLDKDIWARYRRAFARNAA